MQGGLALVIQAEAVCQTSWHTGPLGAGATRSIWLGRPLAGETILSGWSCLDWMAYCYNIQLAWYVLGMNHLFPGAPSQDSP